MSRRVLIIPKGSRRLGSSRYRAYAVGERLRERGWQVVYASPATLPGGQARSLTRLRRALNDWAVGLASDCQVVICQRADRRREQLWLVKALKRRGARLVYDVDDPVDMEHPIAQWLLRSADHIAVASHHLLQAVQGMQRPVTFLPTCVDYRIYDGHRPAPDPGALVTLGWLGTGPAYLQGLERVARILAALPAEVKRKCQFHCLGTLHDPRLTSLFAEDRIGLKSWLVPELDWADEQQIVAALSRFDIGLAPWIGRPGGGLFKIVQYMAAGAVPVADDAGEAQYIVKHGATGYLVPPDDVEQYVALITRLVMDAAHRSHLAAAARQDARDRYSLDVAVDTLERLVELASPAR